MTTSTDRKQGISISHGRQWRRPARQRGGPDELRQFLRKDLVTQREALHADRCRAGKRVPDQAGVAAAGDVIATLGAETAPRPAVLLRHGAHRPERGIGGTTDRLRRRPARCIRHDVHARSRYQLADLRCDLPQNVQASPAPGACPRPTRPEPPAVRAISSSCWSLSPNAAPMSRGDEPPPARRSTARRRSARTASAWSSAWISHSRACRAQASTSSSISPTVAKYSRHQVIVRCRPSPRALPPPANVLSC